MSRHTFEPENFTWDEKSPTFGKQTYSAVGIDIILYDNTEYDIYRAWLNGDAVQFIEPSGANQLTSYYLNLFSGKFDSYHKRCMQVTVSFNPIQAQGAEGGFCLYIEKWMYPRDPNLPNVNLVEQELGITCSTVKALSGPTVN